MGVFRKDFQKKLLEFGNTGLTALLIALALILVGVALFEKSIIIKAAVAAWVILP